MSDSEEDTELKDQGKVRPVSKQPTVRLINVDAQLRVDVQVSAG